MLGLLIVVAFHAVYIERVSTRNVYHEAAIYTRALDHHRPSHDEGIDIPNLVIVITATWLQDDVIFLATIITWKMGNNINAN